jgi:K+/H+ antiporter YhaU regulatory subunit KhtT
MKLWDNIKNGFKKGTKKITEATEELVEKGKESGSEGLETVKEMITSIGDETLEVTTMFKLKYEAGSLQKEIEREQLNLGQLVTESYSNRQSEINNESFQRQIDKMVELETTIQSKNREYDNLKKQYSDNYVVNKLSDDLSSTGSVIDQVYISPQSNVVDKLLKEILLPKDTLISAIKRGEKMIIPDGNTKLKADDGVIILGKEEDVQKVKKRFLAGR